MKAMTDARYEKRGSSIRIEWLGGRQSVHRLEEQGYAIERDAEFIVGPGDAALSDMSAELATPSLQPLLDAVPGTRLSPQRMVIVHGRTVHRFSAGTIVRDWSREDHSHHVELGIEGLPFDLTLESIDSVEVLASEIRRIGTALHSPQRQLIPQRVALDPRVSASIVAMRVDAGAVANLRQSPAPGDVDGDGAAIVAGSLLSLGTPPNRARPSYRYAPRHAWMHCAMGAGSETQFDAEMTALAVLEQVYDRRGARVVLLAALDHGWLLLRVEGSWDEWSRAVAATGPPAAIYPFAPAPHRGSSAVLSTRAIRTTVT